MRSRGFTLLEILIVIVIISILSAMLLWGVFAAINAAKDSSSSAMIRSMAGALESYKSQFGDYPPTTVARFRVQLPNETNNGIETLVACLSTKKKTGPFYRPPDEGLYSNVDEDKVDRNPTDWYFGDLQLREIQDNFGNCLWYIHHSDFDKPRKSHTSYLGSSGSKKVEVKVYSSEKTKTHANPGAYQLVSPGKDGKFGTADDLRSW